jgi:hypothetical protein
MLYHSDQCLVVLELYQEGYKFMELFCCCYYGRHRKELDLTLNLAVWTRQEQLDADQIRQQAGSQGESTLQPHNRQVSKCTTWACRELLASQVGEACNGSQK